MQGQVRCPSHLLNIVYPQDIRSPHHRHCAGRERPLQPLLHPKAEVAEAALRAGASIVNDISALRFDPAMASVVA
ncbi:MAG TPA: hypothetical protein ENL11_03915, partial [Candidatus Acetothermia bacterium]|nr:hypothetical protein [Candidatus Acetothermia bacterium]